MKPQTEKLSDPVMKFFTPELFIRFNSPDEEQANRADEEWEAAVQSYRNHLADLRGQMPSQVKKLAELCLHDAEILACEQTTEPFFQFFPLFRFEPLPYWSGFVMLSVRQGDEIVSLFYVLWDQLHEHRLTESWPFSKLNAHWLYDELDIAPDYPGMFLHRILLSDGTIMEIPFVSVLIHGFTLHKMGQSDSSRKTA